MVSAREFVMKTDTKTDLSMDGLISARSHAMNSRRGMNSGRKPPMKRVKLINAEPSRDLVRASHFGSKDMVDDIEMVYTHKEE
jgi:hypothetical protein